jgi:hypothetical protein
MSRTVRLIFLVNAIIWIVLGGLMLAVPGRFLQWLGWGWRLDPIISRLIGAALLALAWGDLRVWRGLTWSQGTVFVEVQLVFSALASLGILRHLLSGSWPATVWILFAVFAIFTFAWLGALLRKPGQPVSA